MPDCAFAHSLFNLRVPLLSSADAWRGDMCDRWIGHVLSEDQVLRFKHYMNVSPFYDVPVWAKGLDWYLSNAGLTEYVEDPWDFGLAGDSAALRDFVTFYPDLWVRLIKRRDALMEVYS